MATKVAVSRYNTPGSTGEVDWDDEAGLGGATPVAALIIGSGATADGTAFADAYGCVGFVTGASNELSMAFSAEDGQANTDCSGSDNATNAIHLHAPGTSAVVVLIANFVDFHVNGMKLNFTDITDSDKLFTVIYFAGAEVTAEANSVTLPSAVDTEGQVDGLGFEPDLVFAILHGGGGANAVKSFGVCVNDGSDTQKAIVPYHHNNAATGDPRTYMHGDRCGGFGISGTDSELEIDNFDSSGFSVFTRGGSVINSTDAYYLALAFSDVSVNLRSLDSPTSTGEDARTGVGFAPQFVMLGMCGAAAEGVHELDADAGYHGFSCFTDDAQFCNSWADEDAADTTNTQSLSDNLPINMPDHAGAAEFVATFVTLDADGHTLDYSATDTGTARKWFELAIEEAGKDIEGTALIDADTFFDGELDFQLFGSLLTDADTLNQGDVSPQQIFASILTDADTLNHGLITHLIAGSVLDDSADNLDGFQGAITVGAVDIEGSILTDADTINDGRLAFIIRGPEFVDADTLNHGQLDLQLFGSILTDVDTLNGGELDLQLFGSILTDADTINDGVVGGGKFLQDIEGTALVDADTFFDGQLDLQLFGGSLFQDADTFFQADIHPSNIFGSLLTDADTLNHGQLDLRLLGSLFEDADTINSGVLATPIFGSILEDANTFNQGLVRPTAIFGSILTNVGTLSHGLIGPISLFGSILEEVDTIFQGLLDPQSLNGSILEDTDTFFGGELRPLSINGSLFEDSDTFFGGEASLEVELPPYRIIIVDKVVGGGDLIDLIDEVVTTSAIGAFTGIVGDRFDVPTEDDTK